MDADNIKMMLAIFICTIALFFAIWSMINLIKAINEYSKDV